jgi:hypothetical protein
MPPDIYSRYSFSASYEDANGKMFLTRAEPIRFEQREDNRNHLVNEGDSLSNLAGRYFDGFTDRPERFWKVIADFQPIPIHDPTIKLSPGSVVVIPSVRFLIEVVFDEGRIREATG